ncbi:MAG: protein-glutamate O-methyltransferase CheR [Acetobacteraceae bacterium]|nr:protein-glutamate O-methyltransferase CheR [Acetobacteraceae bacterium]
MTPQGFDVVARLVKARSGLVLTPDKLYMLETRLAPMLRQQGIASLDALALRLGRGAPEERLAAAVTEALTTNETSFFRDGTPFEHLRKVLPKLTMARPPGAAVRIWSAACSTGQEAYSVAMLAAELAPQLGGRRVEILGTDIAEEILARAREGAFTQFEVQRGLPVQMLVKYFRQDPAGGGRWRIAEPLRAMARFQSFNLLGDPRALGTFDVIFCRNVLIYFDPPTKAQVLAAVASRLAPDGYLYLGGAETVLGLTDRLVPVPGQRGVHELPRPAALTA